MIGIACLTSNIASATQRGLYVLQSGSVQSYVEAFFFFIRGRRDAITHHNTQYNSQATCWCWRSCQSKMSSLLPQALLVVVTVQGTARSLSGASHLYLKSLRAGLCVCLEKLPLQSAMLCRVCLRLFSTTCTKAVQQWRGYRYAYFVYLQYNNKIKKGVSHFG